MNDLYSAAVEYILQSDISRAVSEVGRDNDRDHHYTYEAGRKFDRAKRRCQR